MMALKLTSYRSVGVIVFVVLLFYACVQMADACQCPDTSCMQLSFTQRRCECCVFHFLGKRTPKPSVNAFSKKEALSSYSTYADQEVSDIDYWFRLTGLSDP